jgi:hypothetical protein
MTDLPMLPDGVYLGLAEDDYFAQDRLGSTDLATCLRGAADWWYSSKHNPDIDPPTRTDERDFGTALHTLILEGDAAFAARFRIKPSVYPDATTGELKPWHGGAKYCIRWAAETPEGMDVLPEKWAVRVRHMAQLILNHPQYREPLREGIPEVSVLFHWEGEPMRARIDYLLPKFLIDLKTFGGHQRGDGSLDKAMRIVAERDYDVQRFLYDRAREAMIELINEGYVWGASEDQRAWLERLAAETDWGWVWLFYGRRDDRIGRAPTVMPIYRKRFDVTFDTGRVKALQALKNYRACVAMWGFDTPWADIRPMVEPPDHAWPPWLQYAANDDHTPDEETDAA